MTLARYRGMLACAEVAGRMAENHVYVAARALAVGWLEALEGAEAESAVRFRYLVALAAERAGILRRVAEVPRDGDRVVVLAEPLGGATYEVADPRLGEAEGALVDGTEWALFGGATPLRAPRSPRY